MPDIIEIVGQLLHRILFALAVGIIYLRPAGDPRFNDMPEIVERNLVVAFRAFHPFRRGPIRLSSPLNTFHSCGNSSIRSFRSHAPGVSADRSPRINIFFPDLRSLICIC